MALRLEMLQVARLAPKLLGESAELVANFLRSKQNPDGGFQDRDGTSDLYYTLFAMDGLMALQQPPPLAQLRAYLLRFEAGDELDFVHCCCLARLWSFFPEGVPDELGRDRLLDRIEAWRTPDGGWHPAPKALRGSVYGCFLASAAYSDLKVRPSDWERVGDCLDRLRTADGAWANEPDLPFGDTPATSAAVALHRHLGKPIHPEVTDWLFARAHKDGGFVAAPGVPVPDLLSTAVALHALDSLEEDLSPVREATLDFIDTLWTNEGGFHGHWTDDALDVEYTYYGLLALGHLA